MTINYYYPTHATVAAGSQQGAPQLAPRDCSTAERTARSPGDAASANSTLRGRTGYTPGHVGQQVCGVRVSAGDAGECSGPVETANGGDVSVMWCMTNVDCGPICMCTNIVIDCD